MFRSLTIIQIYTIHFFSIFSLKDRFEWFKIYQNTVRTWCWWCGRVSVFIPPNHKGHRASYCWCVSTVSRWSSENPNLPFNTIAEHYTYLFYKQPCLLEILFIEIQLAPICLIWNAISRIVIFLFIKRFLSPYLIPTVSLTTLYYLRFAVTSVQNI